MGDKQDMSVAEIQLRYKTDYTSAKKIKERMLSRTDAPLADGKDGCRATLCDYELIAIGSVLNKAHRDRLNEVILGNAEYDERDGELFTLIELGVVSVGEDKALTLLIDRTRAELLLDGDTDPTLAERARICMEIAFKTRKLDESSLNERLCQIEALPSDFRELVMEYRRYLDSRAERVVVTVSGALSSGELDLIMLSAVKKSLGKLSEAEFKSAVLHSILELCELELESSEICMRAERLNDYLCKCDFDKLLSRLKEFEKRNGK